MARPHKQMPASSYHIIYHEDGSATVECTYLCPYCMQNTTGRFYVSAEYTEMAERGAFFQPVRCDLCGKVTDVRFWKSVKI